MNWKETHLRAVAQDCKDECETHDHRMEVKRSRQECRIRKTVRRPKHCGTRVVHHDCREKSDSEPQRSEQHVFPRSFRRPFGIVNRYQ